MIILCDNGHLGMLELFSWLKGKSQWLKVSELSRWKSTNNFNSLNFVVFKRCIVVWKMQFVFYISDEESGRSERNSRFLSVCWISIIHNLFRYHFELKAFNLLGSIEHFAFLIGWGLVCLCWKLHLFHKVILARVYRERETLSLNT